MNRVVCCVCERSIEGDVFTMGNRPYDADCYARVTRNRRSLWGASLGGIAVLVVFVALAALIFGAARQTAQLSNSIIPESGPNRQALRTLRTRSLGCVRLSLCNISQPSGRRMRAGARSQEEMKGPTRPSARSASPGRDRPRLRRLRR